MTSQVWPPPTDAEQAATEHYDNPLETCPDCEQVPCRCDWCSNCECEECECQTCETCGEVECECYEVYVKYNTTVTVTVDSDGDITYVGVSSDLDEPYDVEDEGGDPVSRHNPIRQRALNAVANQDWPSWDID